MDYFKCLRTKIESIIELEKEGYPLSAEYRKTIHKMLHIIDKIEEANMNRSKEMIFKVSSELDEYFEVIKLHPDEGIADGWIKAARAANNRLPNAVTKIEFDKIICTENDPEKE